jgi:hypothetical protein
MSNVTELAHQALRQEAERVERRSPDVLRRESDRIERRRPDAIHRDQDRQTVAFTPSRSCPPHAALLHQIAALVTTENLPPARITADGSEVFVDASGVELVQNVVRRWAAALELVVEEIPLDTGEGFAATCWTASGYDGTGVFWHVAGTKPVAVPCEAGR